MDVEGEGKPLKVLSAGAARTLVLALRQPFREETGVDLDAVFATAGSIAEAFNQGATCDVVILTGRAVAALVGTARVRGSASLGQVDTGIAARLGEPLPDISTAAALRDALAAAPVLYLPDPVTSTGGAHLDRVVRQLGIDDTIAPRLRPCPSGADAMEALAASTEHGALACGQATEIRSVAGVVLVGPLPGELGLTTEYTAGVSAGSARPALAARLVGLLSAPASRETREACGFADPPASAI
jgi:molybdate transport system substrate-binding protein